MGNDLGKAFEQYFKENWLRCFPDSFIYRLHDQVSGYKVTSQNPCDFLAYTGGKLFLIECKSHDGASIDFSAIPQYPRLLKFKHINGVFPGILIWFKEKDKIIWVPIVEAEKLKESGEKSIGIRHLDDYDILVLPTEKKRVFLEADYSALVKFCEERINDN